MRARGPGKKVSPEEAISEHCICRRIGSLQASCWLQMSAPSISDALAFLCERADELKRLQAERGKVAEELGDFERF